MIEEKKNFSKLLQIPLKLWHVSFLFLFFLDKR